MVNRSSTSSQTKKRGVFKPREAQNTKPSMSLSPLQSTSSHRHSAVAGNSSNPFRSHSRDNLPSFDDCFAGFNDRLRLSQLGERHIAAPSPQQWHPSIRHHSPVRGPPTTQTVSASHVAGSTDLRGLQSEELPPTSGLRPLWCASPSIVAHGGGPDLEKDPAEFSYRTLPVSDQDSSDDETAAAGGGRAPAGTPPRPIERSPGHPSTLSTPNMNHRDHPLPSPSLIGGMDTPLSKRPPLHPNVSPIYSPSRAAGRAANSAGGLEFAQGRLFGAYHDSEPRVPGSAPSSAAPLSSGAPQSSTARPIASLDEAVVNGLFPLFAQFLRSLPSQQLERVLAGGSSEAAPGSFPVFGILPMHGASGPWDVGTPAQLAEAIIPPADVISGECGARLGDREFSYYRPSTSRYGLSSGSQRLRQHRSHGTSWSASARSNISLAGLSAVW